MDICGKRPKVSSAELGNISGVYPLSEFSEKSVRRMSDVRILIKIFEKSSIRCLDVRPGQKQELSGLSVSLTANV